MSQGAGTDRSCPPFPRQPAAARTGSKWSGASRSLPAQRAASHRCGTMAPGPPCWPLMAGQAAPRPAGACPASAARLGAAHESTQRYLWGKKFGVCSCPLDSLLLPLVFRSALLRAAVGADQAEPRGASPSEQHSLGAMQTPLIYSSFYHTITKGAQLMLWGTLI